MDILLDESHDIVFVNGETPVTRANFDVVAQRLRIRLKTFLTEYNFNTSYGIPYFQAIFGRRVRKSEIDYIFQEEIFKEEGVVQIQSFESTLRDSVYTVRFTVINDKNLISPTVEITTNI